MMFAGLRELTNKATISASKSDPSTVVIVCAAVLCAFLPLDISQLSFALLGAVLYAFLQRYDDKAPKKQHVRINMNPAPRNVAVRAPKPAKRPTSPVALKVVSSPSLADVRAASVQPILAPTFQSKGWDGEIQELLGQITPTPEVDRTVNQLAKMMEKIAKKVIPEIELAGFASGNFTCGKAFGVAVPDVDIIATVSPQILFQRLHSRSAEGSTVDTDAKKLQKCAMRTLTDKFVATAGLKFRRSAFRGIEPKVTLLAPASLGFSAEAIPIDFSVNIVTPMYNAALLSECGIIDIRTKELILLVKRWAKDRGICHAAKGHLAPYLWGLLSVYFLQAGVNEEGPLLPGLEQFEMFQVLRQAKNAGEKQQKWNAPSSVDSKNSVGALFKQFVHFYHSEFDWCKEQVSILQAQRSTPAAVSGDSQVGPHIADPFQHAQNLGDGMTLESFARLKEELLRAETLCLSDASLSELLEPWSPPDFDSGKSTPDEESVEEKADRLYAYCGVRTNTKKEKVASSPPAKSMHKKLPAVSVQSGDWRRDAAAAQKSAVGPSSTPPWRR